jgi:hypothetical protein
MYLLQDRFLLGIGGWVLPVPWTLYEEWRDRADGSHDSVNERVLFWDGELHNAHF